MAGRLATRYQAVRQAGRLQVWWVSRRACTQWHRQTCIQPSRQTNIRPNRQAYSEAGRWACRKKGIQSVRQACSKVGR